MHENFEFEQWRRHDDPPIKKPHSREAVGHGVLSK